MLRGAPPSGTCYAPFHGWGLPGPCTQKPPFRGRCVFTFVPIKNKINKIKYWWAWLSKTPRVPIFSSQVTFIPMSGVNQGTPFLRPGEKNNLFFPACDKGSRSQIPSGLFLQCVTNSILKIPCVSDQFPTRPPPALPFGWVSPVARARPPPAFPWKPLPRPGAGPRGGRGEPVPASGFRRRLQRLGSPGSNPANGRATGDPSGLSGSQFSCVY